MRKKEAKNKKDDFIPSKEAFSDDFYGSDWNGWGLVIRQLRDFTDMDQAIFGRLIGGYTRPQISRYETETAEPPIDFWIKMSKMFGLNITWALSGKGLPYTDCFDDSDERTKLIKWTVLINDKEDFLEMLRGE